MHTIIILGPAEAYAQDPQGFESITDRKTLLRFDGLVCQQVCADLLQAPRLSQLVLSGGQLRLASDEDTLIRRLVSAYQVSSRFSEEDTQLLVEATRAQMC